MNDESKKEREIMMVMRKLLTTIVREVTPEHKSLRHPLSDQTIQDIRNCLGLITAREKELADAAGRTAQERPYFADQPAATKVVPISKIGKVKREDED
ncbi:MAG: segregation and condensation protein A [Candidatus Thiodiazotropha sp. (ex Dulcina madagascariensis)]|nr:segregation and condensation protein A [Candidatus Thiodiazotropha sp. (ex Dulcina madagascariensis)]MCU7926794.1 segregation and condensation protein A [Candidatus Thiodiazotropha sp. (ex Dulcina madagascariensis)]